MRLTMVLASATAVLALTAGGTGIAQTAQAENTPWIEMETTSVSLGLGGQSGEGVLRLPNLGTNCAYAFKVDGFGAGIKVGVSHARATGPIAGMTRVADLSGDYGATEGNVTLLAGAGGISMKNRRNNVTMNLKSETTGLDLGFGAQGMTIKMPDRVVNAPRAYIVEFGFNKTWVNQDSRAVLDQITRAWKCRYANIWLFGHTDSVGKEDTNIELSAKRSSAVRDYLVGAGIVSTRVYTQAEGEGWPRPGACPPLERAPRSPPAVADQVTVLGIQNGRFWPDTQGEALLREGVQALERERAAARITGSSSGGSTVNLSPANFLAVSGGGDDGAFGAGLICGWSDSGKMPASKLVTGVSTGSMIAPFAFLGGAYLGRLRTLYTTSKPVVISEDSWLFGAFLSAALADT